MGAVSVWSIDCEGVAVPISAPGLGSFSYLVTWIRHKGRKGAKTGSISSYAGRVHLVLPRAPARLPGGGGYRISANMTLHSQEIILPAVHRTLHEERRQGEDTQGNDSDATE